MEYFGIILNYRLWMRGNRDHSGSLDSNLRAGDAERLSGCNDGPGRRLGLCGKNLDGNARGLFAGGSVHIAVGDEANAVAADGAGQNSARA